MQNSISPETQADKCVQYKHCKLGELNWSTDRYPETAPPGFFIDNGVSAYDKNHLAKRPAGSKLLESLHPGDHVLVWSVDRMFRNVGDFGVTIDAFRRKGIYVHFIADDIDLSTPSGQLKAALLAVLAEHFSRMLGFRVREAAAIKKLKSGTGVPKSATRAKPIMVNEVTEIKAEDKPSKILIPFGRPQKPKEVSVRRAWGYIRVSSDGQLESGLGLASQRLRVEEELAKYGAKDVECMGIIADEAVSAFRVPFDQRPGGEKFLSEAKPGDCLVVYRGDRIFRSLRDMANTVNMLRRRGIVLRLIEENVQTDSTESDWYMSLVTMFAELESKIKSARVTECFSRMRREGLCYTDPRRWLLYKAVKCGNQRRLVVDWKRAARFQMTLIAWREWGFKLTHSCAIVNAIVAQEKGIKPAIYCLQGRTLKTKSRKKPKYNPVFSRQISTLNAIWPQFLDSIGGIGAKRLDKVARDQLATNISEVSLAFLQRSGVPIDRLTRHFIVGGIDARVPVESLASDHFLTSTEDL